MTTQTPENGPGTPERPEVLAEVDWAGTTWYLWREDGLRPVIDDLSAWRNNTHLHRRGQLAADYCDRFGPEGAA